MGRFDDAMAHYERAIAIQPDYAEAHLNRAEIEALPALVTAIWRRSKRWPAERYLSAEKALYVHFALAKASGRRRRLRAGPSNICVKATR